MCDQVPAIFAKNSWFTVIAILLSYLTSYCFIKICLIVQTPTSLLLTLTVMAICYNNRGWLDYDKLVSHYWPEFAQNGKDNITVALLLSHQVYRSCAISAQYFISVSIKLMFPYMYIIEVEYRLYRGFRPTREFFTHMWRRHHYR